MVEFESLNRDQGQHSTDSGSGMKKKQREEQPESLARMSSSFSVLEDRTGSFMMEKSQDQSDLDLGEGFIDGNSAMDADIEGNLASIDMESFSAHGTMMGDSEHGTDMYDSDEEFGAVSALNTLKSLKPTHNLTTKLEGGTPATEISDDDDSDDAATGKKPPSDSSNSNGGAAISTGTDEGTVQPNTLKSEHPILQSERKAAFASQQLKSTLSVGGRSNRFVPDKVLINILHIMKR